jgi:hypothetical protein
MGDGGESGGNGGTWRSTYTSLFWTGRCCEHCWTMVAGCSALGCGRLRQQRERELHDRRRRNLIVGFTREVDPTPGSPFGSVFDGDGSEYKSQIGCCRQGSTKL